MIKTTLLALLLAYFPGIITVMISKPVGQAFLVWLIWGILMTIKAIISEHFRNPY